MKRTFLYEIIFAILAFIAVTLAFLDLANKIPSAYYPYYLVTDRLILLVFAVDYFYRLYQANDKKFFFKNNIFDLLAIIPLDFFRAFRLLRLFRLFKIIRMAIYLKRFTSRLDSFLKTNGFIYILYITCASILIASGGIYYLEKGKTIESFADALWWSFVTVTTVGYGDISPQTGFGRILAAILMTIGIGFIGMLTATIATFFIKNKKGTPFQPEQILHLQDLTPQQYQEVCHYVDYLKEKTS